MSEPETTDTGGTVFDDPNREAVGLDPAWVEGTGGESGEATPKAADAGQPAAAAADPDTMTKDELLAYAQELGVSPANASMSKDDLRAGIDQKQAETG